MIDARLIYLVEIWPELSWLTRKRIDLVRGLAMLRQHLRNL